MIQNSQLLNISRAPYARLELRAQHGGLLIEVLIVMLIVGIVSVIGAIGFRGAGKSGYLRESQAVGREYYDAIQQFQRDHGGRLPAYPSTTDWLSTRIADGPMDAQRQPYIHSQLINQHVIDGTIELQYLPQQLALPTAWAMPGTPDTTMTPPTKALAAVIIRWLRVPAGPLPLPAASQVTADVWVRSKKNSAWKFTDLRCTVNSAAAISPNMTYPRGVSTC